MKVAVTGANGFVGRAIVEAIERKGYKARAIVRAHTDPYTSNAKASETVRCNDLLTDPLEPMLANCDAVINCAARVHITKREDEGSWPLYERMNSDFPCDLAGAARRTGATRFIQISSVAAIGSSQQQGHVLSDASHARPDKLYGKSKLAADERLAKMSDDRMTIVSLRPPAVYGPGVGAWFAMLAKAARYAAPLPLASMENARSFIFVRNLAEAVVATLASAADGAFVVTDHDPIPVRQLYGDMLAFYGKPDTMWHCPSRLVRMLARSALGTRASSLTEDARYDGSRFFQTFRYKPSVPYAAGLAKTLATL